MKTKNEAGYEVGDILSSTWGYSMQIVDFYQVVAVTPKMITVRKIASKIESGNGMQGTSVPVPDAFVQKPHHWQTTEFKRKVLPGGYINIDSVSCAHKWNGQPLYHDHMD